MASATQDGPSSYNLKLGNGLQAFLITYTTFSVTVRDSMNTKALSHPGIWNIAGGRHLLGHMLHRSFPLSIISNEIVRADKITALKDSSHLPSPNNSRPLGVLHSSCPYLFLQQTLASGALLQRAHCQMHHIRLLHGMALNYYGGV